MKRKRVVTLKPTRDGCKTCRLRRIRCDEVRPHCSKCTSSGRECEYGTRVLPACSSHSSRTLLPLHEEPSPHESHKDVGPKILSPVTPELSSILSFSNEDDRHAYDYFLKVVIGPIAATSPTQEWIDLALRHCQVKPVFHAMAAAGNSYRANNRTYHATLTHHLLPVDLDAAMRQYDKAVKTLQMYINDVVDHGAAIEPVLLASILLTCFEVMIDRRGTAVSHYRLGRRIVAQSVQEAKWRSPHSSRSLEAIDHLAFAFRSLDHGAEYYWHESERITVSTSETYKDIPNSMPSAFSSFIEADVHLQDLVRSAEDVRNELVTLAQTHISRIHDQRLSQNIAFCLANCLSRSINISSGLQHRLDGIRSAHMSWLNKLQRHSSNQHAAPDQISLLTQVRYFASWFAISTCRETRESLVDRFEPEFVRVLDLTEQYLRDTCGHPQPIPPPRKREAAGLSFEGGILPALHLIACKSRSSTIRRRAAMILCSANRQELTCHSAIIGSIVGFAGELEERRARALQGVATAALQDFNAEQVSEEARFADCVVKIISTPSFLRPSFWLTCARYSHEQERRIEVAEYRGEGCSTDLRLQSQCVFDCSAKAFSSGQPIARSIQRM